MGKRLVTPADFTDLVGAIEHDTGVHVGITTVKRLWGYVSNDSRLRDGTLSVFARFVGYRDWTAFREAVREAAGTDSEFLTDRQITASGLAVGDRVELGWQPDRYCLVRHDGGGRFTVEKSVNANCTPAIRSRHRCSASVGPFTSQTWRNPAVGTPLMWLAKSTD